MTALSRNDVGEIVKEMNETLQATETSATPRKLAQLLDHLEEETDDVQAARMKFELLGIPSLPSGEVWLPQGEGLSQMQWSLDMAAWQIRLASYRDALSAVPESEMDTPAGALMAYKGVTAPLLDGLFYEEYPGILLNSSEKKRIRSGEGHSEYDTPARHPGGHSNPKPPDVILPFTLGNQIIVYQESMREAFERFKDEVLRPPALDPDTWPTWIKAAIIIGAAGATIGAGYMVMNSPYVKGARKILK